MKKKIGAFGARQVSLGTLVGGRPGTTIFQNPGGGEGGGGLGGVAYKDRARPPPRAMASVSCRLLHERFPFCNTSTCKMNCPSKLPDSPLEQGIKSHHNLDSNWGPLGHLNMQIEISWHTQKIVAPVWAILQ